MMLKKLYMINWLQKLILVRYQVLVCSFVKRNTILTNKISKKKIKGVNNKITNTSELVKKADWNTKITEIENKILSVTDLVTTTGLNAKVIEIENKIRDITNLATKAALNTTAKEIENKIPDSQFY